MFDIGRVARAMRLIADIGSARLKIVLDPANLFEQATAGEARAIVANAVERTAGHVAMAHAKDRFADGRFARITAFMTLHGVNDLPGALLLCRRALMSDGRFQAAFPAGFSLGAVREAFLEADVSAGGGVSARVGPTVDPAEAAGLLQRAGFLDPVAEVDTLTLRYQSLTDLARDVRAHGDSGWLASRAHGLTTPRRWAAAEAVFARDAAADGRVGVEVQILYLSAKAP